MAVFFVGPLPPPVHGFSNINAEMLARLQARGPVQVLDRAPPRAFKGGMQALATLAQWAWHVLRFALATLASPRRGALYMGLSGGRGQWLDFPFLWLAHRAGLRVFVHHHSYAYLNTRSSLTDRVLRAAPQAQHITLCDDMKGRLAQQYALQRAQVRSLSNAAFMPDAPRSTQEPVNTAGTAATAAAGHTMHNQVALGFLSNITAEKGIFEFLHIVRDVQARGVAVKALIAGPVAADIQAEFDAALRQTPGAQHLGPVYGPDKTAFLQNIDALVFPTRYVNEAEPLTIHEALAHGAAVLAAARGCIAGMLPQGCGCSQPLAQLSEAAQDWAARWATLDGVQRQHARQQVQAAHRTLVGTHQQGLQQLLRDIQP